MFDGNTYDPILDRDRLISQLSRVRRIMSMGDWWTLSLLAEAVGGSEAGVSARLRDLRKSRFGGYTVNRRRVRDSGLFEYQLLKPGQLL